MPGGLSYRLVVDLLHSLNKKADIYGFNLVEFAPEKDINGLGALTAARIVFNMIGALARSESLLKKADFKKENHKLSERNNRIEECGAVCKEAEIFKDQTGSELLESG